MWLEGSLRFWHGGEMVVRPFSVALCAVMLLGAAHAVYAAGAKPATWGSISAGKAMMRTGPGRNFPAMWEYRRPGLPVKVIDTYPNWRKIIDPDGATGWVQSNLLSDSHTAVVKGGDVRSLRQNPNENAPVIWRIEAGVVGKLSECRSGWCKIDVRGRMGYIESSELWGVD